MIKLGINNKTGLSQHGHNSNQNAVNPEIGNNKCERKRNKQKDYKIKKPEMPQKIDHLIYCPDNCRMS